MFKRWLVGATLPWVGVCCDTPDASGGGAGADPNASGAASSAADDSGDAGDDAGTDAAGTRQTATSGDGAAAGDGEPTLEDLIDDDSDDQARPAEERIKALAAKNRKAMRKLARLDPIARRLQGVDLDDLLMKARGYDELLELASSDPTRAKRMLALDREEATSRTDGKRTAADSRATASQDDGDLLIDPATLPFDPKRDEVHGFFGKLVDIVNQQHKEIRRLTTAHEASERRVTGEAAASRQSSWKTALDTYAAQISDPGVREVFKDSMRLAYRDNEARVKSGGRSLTPQFVAAHWMKKLGAGKAEAARAADVLRQKNADKTKNLNRSATTTGAPAGSGGNRPFTLADARKHLESLG